MAPEIFYGIGALILLLALVWVVSRGGLKSRRAKAISEQATKERIQDPEHYDDARHDELEAAAKSAEEAAEAREKRN